MQKPPFHYWQSTTAGSLRCKISNNSWFVSDISFRSQSRQVFISLPIWEKALTRKISAVWGRRCWKPCVNGANFNAPPSQEYPPPLPLTHRNHRRMLWEISIRESFCDKRGRNTCQTWASITLDDVLWSEKLLSARGHLSSQTLSNISAESCLSTPFKTYPWTFSPSVWFEEEQDGFCVIFPLSQVSILLRIWAGLYLEKLCSS